MMPKFRTSGQWVFVLNQWHGGSSVNLMKALQKLPHWTHAEALALCTMLLDSGIIDLNHVDVAWLQLWMFSLRLCCWNAAVLLWYLGYLLYLFHGTFSINVFFDILLKAKVNGQTALCYAARQVRVKQMRCSQWAVVVHQLGNSVPVHLPFTSSVPLWQGTCADHEVPNVKGHRSKLSGQEGQNCVARLFLSWGQGQTKFSPSLLLGGGWWGRF